MSSSLNSLGRNENALLCGFFRISCDRDSELLPSTIIGVIKLFYNRIGFKIKLLLEKIKPLPDAWIYVDTTIIYVSMPRYSQS